MLNLVDGTELNSSLNSIANAIRTKGGTASQLSFPAGFVQAINNISTGGAAYGYIAVITRAGATLTATNGTSTLTATATSGKYIFAIPSSGTWTITAALGANTESKTVEVIAGWYTVISLKFSVAIFDPEIGGDNTELTGGWTTPNQSLTEVILSSQEVGARRIATVTGTSNIITAKSIDMTGYSKIVINAKTTNTDSRGGYIGLSQLASPTILANYRIQVDTGNVYGEYEIDISSLDKSKKYFIMMNVYAAGAQSGQKHIISNKIELWK